MKILKIIGIFILGSLAFAGITQRNVPGGENNIYLGLICLILALLLFFSLIQHKRKTRSTDINVNTADKITPNIHNSNSEHLHTTGNNSFLDLPKDVISLLYIKGGAFSNYKESLKTEPSLIDLSLPIDTTCIMQEDTEEDIGYYPSYTGLRCV